MGHFTGAVLVVTMSNVFLYFASTSISKKPVDTEVMVGHSTYLNCSTSDSSREIHWYHYSVGAETKDHEYVYAHGQMHPPYDKRFRIEKDHAPGSFDLVITNVELQDSGLYVCQNGGDTGQLVSAQLVVLDSPLSCKSNIKPEGFIGPNSCNLNTDEIELLCEVYYHGNIHPAIYWTNDGHITRMPASNVSCNDSGSRITCNMTLDAEIDMDGSTFVCQTKRAVQDQYNCTTDDAKILYALGNKTHVQKIIGDDASCLAEANGPCSYKWIWSDGVNDITLSIGQNLTAEKQGWSRCEATCTIKEKPCTVVPMLVNASPTPGPVGECYSRLHVAIAIVATFIVLLISIIATASGYFIVKAMNGSTNKLTEVRENQSAWMEEKKRMQEELRQLRDVCLRYQTFLSNEISGCQELVKEKELKENMDSDDESTSFIVVDIDSVESSEDRTIKASA